jgi:hypothetical protein
MGFLEKIQKDIKEGLIIVKEGSALVSQRIEELTDEGRRKYKVLTINMKLQDEFAKLGNKVYGLRKKTGNPMMNKRIQAIISRIKILEEKLTALKKGRKKSGVKTRALKPRPAAAKKRSTSGKKRTVKKK